MNKFFLLAIALCTFQFSFAQITVTKHDLTSFHSSPATHAMAQAADGIVYVVMVDYQFDGDGKVFAKGTPNGWEAMTPPCDDCILTVASDADGVIWAGTTEGIYQLNDIGEWTLVVQTLDVSLIHFTPSGLMYLIDKEGLASWDGTTYTSHTGSGTPVTVYVRDIVSDSNDKIWMQPAGAPFSFDGTDFGFIGSFALPDGFGFDENNVLWLSDAGDIYYEENGDLEDSGFPSEFNTLAPHAGFTIDRDYIFWIGQVTISGALYRYNKATGNIQKLTWTEIDPNIDQDWRPSKFYEDREGDMWIASGQSGVWYEFRDSETPPSALNAALKSENIQVNIAPNPILNNQLSLQLDLATATTLNINITNTLGQVIYSVTKMELPRGKQNANLDLPNLSPGVYQLYLNTSEDEELVKRFSVN